MNAFGEKCSRILQKNEERISGCKNRFHIARKHLGSDAEKHSDFDYEKEKLAAENEDLKFQMGRIREQLKATSETKERESEALMHRIAQRNEHITQVLFIIKFTTRKIQVKNKQINSCKTN